MNEHLKDKIKGHLKKLAKKKPLEDYCTNCGVCCRPQVTIMSNGEKKARILAKELSCKFMEWGGKESKCPVYDDRHKKAHWCVDIETVIKEGIAPNDCPYADTLEGYRGVTILNDDDYSVVLPLLKETVAKGDPDPINEDQLRKFLGGK